jgi:hypothetical protein
MMKKGHLRARKLYVRSHPAIRKLKKDGYKIKKDVHAKGPLDTLPFSTAEVREGR